MAKHDDTRDTPALKGVGKAVRFLTVQSNPESYPRQIPWLRLRGNWLATAGFPPQTRIKVRVMQGCLVITAEEPVQ